MKILSVVSPSFGRRGGARIRKALLHLRSECEMWRAKRQLLSVDPGLFKDAGVSIGNVDWLVRNGRDG